MLAGISAMALVMALDPSLMSTKVPLALESAPTTPSHLWSLATSSPTSPDSMQMARLAFGLKI